MKLPKLDLASLPDLDTLTGLFGTANPTATGASTPTTVPPGHDDSIVVLATYVYEVVPPQTFM